MGKICCDRCRKEVDATQLPTHQNVKFDTVVNYLHGDADDLESCWGQFRQRISKRRKTSDSDYLAGEYIPTSQYVKDGLDARVLYLTAEDWEGFRRWFYCGRQVEERNRRVA